MNRIKQHITTDKVILAVALILFVIYMILFGWEGSRFPTKYESSVGMSLEGIEREVKCEIMEGRIICPYESIVVKK